MKRECGAQTSAERSGRKVQGRVSLTNNDRWFFIQLYRWFPAILQVLTVLRPETLVHCRRAGFRRCWRWKSRSVGVRPPIETVLRVLIRRMNRENPLWGALRIHGELLKLGFQVAQSTVAKYIARRRGPPSQGRKTFFRNHAPDIAAIDLFVVATVSFKLLYGIVIIRLDRRRLVCTNVTTNPTAEWIARQITEAFRWDQAPRHLLGIATGRTVPSSFTGYKPWESVTIRPRHARHGRIAM